MTHIHFKLLKFYYRFGLHNHRGQALLEFLMLLAMTFFMAMAMMKIANASLGKIWMAMIDVVAKPQKVYLR